jgi:hypothetical protein
LLFLQTCSSSSRALKKKYNKMPKRMNKYRATIGIIINGAKAGMTLEIRVNRIRTGRWGWSAGPGAPAQLDPYLGLGPGLEGPPAVITVPRGDNATLWELDPEAAIGINRAGQWLKLRPFMGIMGMPLDQPGIQAAM